MERAQICPNPIFIIGSPRSGTSILAWSLAQHSQLWTSAESDILFYLFGHGHLEKAYETAFARPDGTWLSKQKVDRSEFYSFLGLGINAMFTSRSDGRRWIDQTPLYTLIVDILAELFPGAQFLHILRDGRRVVHSMIHFEDNLGNELAAQMEKAARLPPWARDFRDACRTWCHFVDSSMGFCSAHPSRSLTVTNEKLVKHPRDRFRDILEFLGVPGEDAPSSYFQSHRINSSFPRFDAASAPAAHLANPWDLWSFEQRSIFLHEAGPTMLKYGLASEDDMWLTKDQRDVRILAALQHAAEAAVPQDSRVAVVSKGDPRLMELGTRRTSHFPQDDVGRYSGHHPADSEEAIAHLERLRARGIDYLVIPETSLWWLDYYSGFCEYLNARYRRLPTDPSCAIYDLFVIGQGGYGGVDAN